MQEIQETWFDNPWVGRIPRSRKWHPTPVFLPEKFHGQKSLSGYSLVGLKELDTIEHTHTYLFTSLYATAYTFIHIHTYVNICPIVLRALSVSPTVAFRVLQRSRTNGFL